MDYHIHIDTKSMELSILYFKGVTGQNFNKMMYSVPEDCFYLINSADPDEIPPCVALHLGLHYLPQYLFTGVTVSFFPSQFFPRGKNGPAHSFPGEKTDRSVFSPGERFD